MNITLIFNVSAVVCSGIAVGIGYRYPTEAVVLAYLAGLLTAKASQYSITIVKEADENDLKKADEGG